MVSLALEERGISVVSVGNGEAAVRRIPDLDPDLVLADIFMPVRNGYEVCEFVKKDERFAHVPVILLVGAFDPLDEKEARRVGADGVLKKPFVPPDPLIAMVTSALEKNPRLAAELAKAKEAKVVPDPEPMPSVDLSARPEPKPLPEFPEPSPEEAALIYGMGKGHRSLDVDEQSSSDEPPAPKADPNAQAADEDDADEAASAPDWRRSAMDLEIPEDVAVQPAIPSMRDTEPISFPSEKDYPPRRVRGPEPIEEAQPVVASDFPTSESGFSLRQVKEPHSESAAETAGSAGDLPEALKLQTGPEQRPPIGLHPAADFAAPLPEPNLSTAVNGHWLDGVTASPTEKPAADWMETLVGGQTESHAAPAAEAVPAIEESAASAIGIESNSIHEVAEEMLVAAPSPSAAELAVLNENVHHERDDEPFFADEGAEEESATAHVSATPSGSGDAQIEMEPEDSEPPFAMKDPALVEPPAVHVEPEPLLVDEETSAPPRYGTPAEESAPLHSFLAPAAKGPADTSASVQQPIAGEFTVQAESDESVGSSGEEANERVPTMPPPNRESLSHIPFLTPPPSFLAEIKNAKSQEALAADPATIDTVVQRVLEKLQPQIQELLSQGLLKPLVESLLQNELDKKR